MPKCLRLGALLLCGHLVFGPAANAAPIHDAALDGNLEELKLLLDAGADVNAPDDAGTPLQWAFFASQVVAIKLLLERGADPNVSGPAGTPLHSAVAGQNLTLVNLLLAHGADPNLGKGAAPLATAAQKGSLDLVDLLLENGADPDFPTREGVTALHEAAKFGHLAVAARLLEGGADINTLTLAGRPAIHFAVLGKHDDMVDLLIRQGATPGPIEPISEMLASADVANGKSEAERLCLSCHKFEVGETGFGPHFWNLLGRRKGSVAGFAYSPPLSERDDSWTYEDLNAFIARPAEIIPGTTMQMIGIADPQRRANLIAFFRTLSDSPMPLPHD